MKEMNSTIKNILGNAYPVIQNNIFRMIGTISPKTLASIQYQRGFGRKIDWNDPKDINEKINWLKFNTDTTAWTTLADKFRVREHVERMGLGNMLVKLYGHWDDAEDINWDALPRQFIMKTNNGSGEVFICKDKAEIDTAAWTAAFKTQLAVKFGRSMGEPHYNRIKPCIIAEELLDCRKQPIPSSSLIDYKIWSFDGKPAYIWACYNRTHASVQVALYDLDWNFHPEYSISTPHYILADKPMPKPKSLDQMLHAAAVLSKGFPELRVDLYEVDDKPYFGELTFSSAAGFNDFYTPEFLRILGDLTILNK